jgi:DNA polymerase-1
VAIEDGFEADDQLATITAIGLATDRQVVLASPDKDIRQCLVSGRVSILRGFTVEHGKLKRPEWLTAKGVEEKYGVRPEQWTDFQALTGDAGDGIEGCPGFGPVNAQKVLSAAGTLDRVFTHILGLPITPRLRTSLLNWQPLARDVLRLVTLRTDCQAAADALR